MRLWCDSTRRLESNVSSRDVFQLANAGTDFVVLDFQRARRLHASFLLRIGDKVFSDFNRYRQAVLGARNLKNRLLLPMSSAHVMLGENAPVALTRACESAFGAANDRYFLPFSVAAGVIGWHEHYRRGIDVCNWRVRPAYGVFAPTRTLYCEMIERGLKKRGRLALDVGTGSGVLALILSRSFDRVIGTDLLEAAVTCARENVRLNGVKNVEIVRADLFPEGADLFDCIVFNPPWIPGRVLTDVDFAVFDEKGETLKRFLAASSMRLAPNGRVLVVISNLAELCGLREPFAQVAANAGWRVQLLEQRALPTKEKGFVLEQKRREVLTLFELRRD